MLKIPESYYVLQLENPSDNGGARLKEAIALASKFFPQEESILDVGCGGRTNLNFWRDRNVSGYDLNPGIKGSITGDMHDMTSQYGKWDCLFSSHTLEHSFDYHHVLEEFKQVAKRIFIVVPLESKEEFKSTKKHPVRVTTWGVLKHFPKYQIQFFHRHKPGKELVLQATAP